MNHPVTLRLLPLSLVLLLTSCSGALYKVKPAIDLPTMPPESRTANGAGLTLRSSPLFSDEQSQDLFEANLPLAGVLPVRIELNYETGGVPIELKRTRFQLRDAKGREWKLLPAKKAVSQILKANDVYVYNPHSREQFEKEFSAYEIDLKTPLSASEKRRQGFLFFQAPEKELVRSPTGLVLSISGLSQPLELALN